MTENKSESLAPKRLFSILILSAFASTLTFDIASFTINVSQIIAILLFAALILYNAVNKTQFLVLYKDNLSLLIYLYFFSNVFSSLLFASDTGKSLKGCAVIFSYVLVYITVRWAMKLSDNPVTINKLMKYNQLSAIFGLGCMIISFITGKENIGVTYGHLAQSGMNTLESPIPSINSLSIEPNVFAIVTAVILCMNLSIYFLWGKSRKQLLVIGMLTVAILFSYTRSVYVSLAFAIFCLIILSKRTRLIISFFNYAIVIVAIVALLFVLLPDDNDIKHAIITRANTLFDFNKGSGLGRVQGYIMGLQGFIENPLFGKGTLGADTEFFNPFTNTYQELMGSSGWLNGALIQALHDTGIVGFMVVVGIYLSMMVENYRVFKRLDNLDINKTIVLGFIGGNIILFIASQLSSTLWLSFPYIYWAINMSFIHWNRKKLKDKQELAANYLE